jgi:hypothetical protein
MRSFVALAALLLLTSNASAAGWIAQMQEDEGGEVMTASVTGEGPGDFPPMLSMTCWDKVNLRYFMAGNEGDLDETADFTLASEADEVTLSMLYEAMDGAFAAYFGKADPVLALLKGGKDLLVTNPAGKYPPQTFTLEGSSDAIDTLLDSCP